jgi:hypothetical protein
MFLKKGLSFVKKIFILLLRGVPEGGGVYHRGGVCLCY